MFLKNKINWRVDPRTFFIVVAIIVIALPIIILVFRKSFFPIIDSIRNIFNSASISNSGAGLPDNLLNSGQ